MAVTSKAAELILQQPATEQRRLLHLVLRHANWEGGELRMSLRGPFEQLRVSNLATHTRNGHLWGRQWTFWSLAEEEGFEPPRAFRP